MQPVTLNDPAPVDEKAAQGLKGLKGIVEGVRNDETLND